MFIEPRQIGSRDIGVSVQKRKTRHAIKDEAKWKRETLQHNRERLI